MLAVSLAVSGCSIFRGDGDKPTIVYEERPVELLYNTGALRLDQRRWDEAVEYFQEVERQHPYSEWARRAILMTAYANYESNNYAEAIADAERFIALYPGNPSAVYAYYLKATSYFEQIVDVGRDQAATENARNALMEVVQRYPNSEYAKDARLKIDMVNDQLAGKEMTIGRYYLREGQTLAAVGRFRVPQPIRTAAGQELDKFADAQRRRRRHWGRRRTGRRGCGRCHRHALARRQQQSPGLDGQQHHNAVHGGRYGCVREPGRGKCQPGGAQFQGLVKSRRPGLFGKGWFRGRWRFSGDQGESEAEDQDGSE